MNEAIVKKLCKFSNDRLIHVIIMTVDTCASKQ